MVNGTNDVFTIDEWGDYEDLNNFVWAPSNPQFGKYLILSTGQCPYDPNPENPNVTPKPKLHSNTIHKLITIDNDVGKITDYPLTENRTYTIPLPNNKKFVDEVTVNVNVPIPTPEPPVVGHANIYKNGQYLPNMFDHSTGEPLPEGTYSNNQYLDQINVNLRFGINYFRFSSDTPGITPKRKLTRVNVNTSVNVYQNQELIRMGVDNSTGRIWVNFILNSGPWTVTVSAGDYYMCSDVTSGSGRIDFYDSNDNFLFANGTSSAQNAYTYLPNTLYYIDM